MAVEGKLNPTMMGITMPVNAPGFVDKPPFWRGVNSYTFNYETDPDAAVALVPEGLTLPEPVTACLIFNNSGLSGHSRRK
jgi:acetoacetate decarboxylase